MVGTKNILRIILLVMLLSLVASIVWYLMYKANLGVIEEQNRMASRIVNRVLGII